MEEGIDGQPAEMCNVGGKTVNKSKKNVIKGKKNYCDKASRQKQFKKKKSNKTGKKLGKVARRGGGPCLGFRGTNLADLAGYAGMQGGKHMPHRKPS